MNGLQAAVTLSADARKTAGILLLAIVAVEYGGTFILRMTRGRIPLTPFQRAFNRAGHGHAGVLVILALITQLFADAANLGGFQNLLARSGVPIAALLIPGGFFFSAIGRGRTEPNRFIALTWAGVAVLAAGVVALGLGLLAS